MRLSRGEWITLFLFLFALSLNVALMNDVIQRNLGLCGDGFDYGGRPQTPCEEELEEETDD
tara:strand:- start:203 stop:385 length:183 start_codon:yes stop_codon:yes gene_type:complete